jgi:hypothetical protein
MYELMILKGEKKIVPAYKVHFEKEYSTYHISAFFLPPQPNGPLSSPQNTEIKTKCN